MAATRVVKLRGGFIRGANYEVGAFLPTLTFDLVVLVNRGL